MSQTLIPYDALAARGIGLSKCQLWRLERQGKFPKRVSVSAARHAWVASEIDDWITARIAARPAAAAAA
jgi:prophage regulatory protein